MSAPVYQTKGELRSDLLISLGYGGLGASAGMFVPMADLLLTQAQKQIFPLLSDAKRTRVWDFNIGSAQRWADIPDTCDIDKISGIYAWVNSRWIPLVKGIDYNDDSFFSSTTSHPRRYDFQYNSAASKTQIEIWPEPDDVYAVRVEGRMQLGAFVADGDRASIDDSLILLHATAYGKAHLNKPDAKASMDAWNMRLRILKAEQHGQNVYIRESLRTAMPSAIAQPRVV
jgi:hypothetical protein